MSIILDIKNSTNKNKYQTSGKTCQDEYIVLSFLIGIHLYNYVTMDIEYVDILPGKIEVANMDII